MGKFWASFATTSTAAGLTTRSVGSSATNRSAATRSPAASVGRVKHAPRVVVKPARFLAGGGGGFSFFSLFPARVSRLHGMRAFLILT